jgi:hypothetical protein
MYRFTKSFFKGLCENVTYSEKAVWKRLPYLWANMSKQYFNPFDKKSAWKNYRESIESFIDPFIQENAFGLSDINELTESTQRTLHLSNEKENNNLLERESKANDKESQINQSINRKPFQ